MRGHTGVVEALSIYDIDIKPYLASGSWDGTIKIWSLDDYKMTKSLFGEGAKIYSFAVINNDDTRIIASGNRDGYVKLWNLKTFDCMGIF